MSACYLKLNGLISIYYFIKQVYSSYSFFIILSFNILMYISKLNNYIKKQHEKTRMIFGDEISYAFKSQMPTTLVGLFYVKTNMVTLSVQLISVEFVLLSALLPWQELTYQNQQR